MKRVTLLTTYVLGIMLSLAIPSSASEPSDPQAPNESLWSKLKAQKSLNEIYESRWEKDSPLTDEEKKFLLLKCASEGHPLAQLESAENIFAQYVVSAASFTVKPLQPDCSNGVLPREAIHQEREGPISETKTKKMVADYKVTSTSTSLTIQQLEVARDLLKSALKSMLNTPDNHQYLTMTCGLGICGFRPYQPLAHKEALDPEERKTLFAYWHAQHQDAIKLSKRDEGTHETLTFFDRHPTTQFWIQCLYRNLADADLYLLLHQYLNKLNGLPETDFSDVLPWWRDHQ